MGILVVAYLREQSRWSSGGKQVEFIWSSPGVQVYLIQICKFKFVPGGLHLNSVGQCKVLGNQVTWSSVPWITSSSIGAFLNMAKVVFIAFIATPMSFKRPLEPRGKIESTSEPSWYGIWQGKMRIFMDCIYEIRPKFFLSILRNLLAHFWQHFSIPSYRVICEKW